MSVHAVIFNAFVAADYGPAALSTICDPLWVWCIRKEVTFMHLNTDLGIAQ